MVKKLEQVKKGHKVERKPNKEETKKTDTEKDSRTSLSTVDEKSGPVVTYKRGAGPETEAKMRRVRSRCIQKAKIALSSKI